MKAIVIGLGSMGKRRIRCLQALGVMDIIGVDLREDRRIETQKRYNVESYTFFSDAINCFLPDMVIISLPPKLHVSAMNECIKLNVPFFVEASVVEDGLAEVIQLVKRNKITALPSATLYFHPAIQKIYDIVHSGVLGKVSNINLHSGQYLPDWHSYEPVSDYYVSDPETGGAREIVPFEMTWFTELFGFPIRVAGNYRKTIDIDGAPNIDDTYNFLFDYGAFLASITVDVVSRYATRKLIVNGSLGQMSWSWDEKMIKVFDGVKAAWTEFSYEIQKAEVGYNENIGEIMYVEEIRAFIDAVNGKSTFPNSLEKDLRVLKLLYSVERSHKTGQFQNL
jgi:predicted dehydrogenase